MYKYVHMLGRSKKVQWLTLSLRLGVSRKHALLEFAPVVQRRAMDDLMYFSFYSQCFIAGGVKTSLKTQ